MPRSWRRTGALRCTRSCASATPRNRTMPQFAYQGRNARGELVKGTLEGPTSSAVADQLFSTGVTPVHIDEAKAAVAVAASKLQLSFGEPKVELADLMLLSRQMHTLLKSGVPIIRALSGLEQSRSEEHTSELQSRGHLVCRLLLEKKK